jgi:hypothetical protein
VDLSEVDPAWRVVLFLGFGGLFLALSYYLRGSGGPAPRGHRTTASTREREDGECDGDAARALSLRARTVRRAERCSMILTTLPSVPCSWSLGGPGFVVGFFLTHASLSTLPPE